MILSYSISHGRDSVVVDCRLLDQYKLWARTPAGQTKHMVVKLVYTASPLGAQHAGADSINLQFLHIPIVQVPQRSR